MKKNLKLKKYIVLMIIILIPLVAAYLIGLYGYNRYQDNYLYEYMNNIEEDTKAKIHGSLKFSNYAIEEEPYYSEDVKKGDDLVLTVEVYRALKSSNDTTELVYYFLVYNIDYQKIVEIKDPTGERKLLYNKLPGIYLVIEDNNNPDNEKTELFASVGKYFIDDYLSSPEKDSEGNKLTSRYVRWIEYIPDRDFSKDLSIEIIVSDNPKDDPWPGVVTSFDLEVARHKGEVDTDSFTLGYDNDIHKAGYFKHVFKNKIWWQSLIAFALVGFISYSFYAVWAYEEQLRKK